MSVTGCISLVSWLCGGRLPSVKIPLARHCCVFLCLTLVAAHAQERPNILWLTSEDNNVDWVGCYGNPLASTPNIDALAGEGFRYTNTYASVPVCAPQRFTWITGVHALSAGTHPMRSRYPVPHDQLVYYPDVLREAGYYTGNATKTDYNAGGRQDEACWDNTGKVNWAQLKAHQPFFQVINFGESHESRAQGEVENTRHDPANTQLRAYHPDVPTIRKNYAKYHDAVERMDADIGEALKQLEANGLADDTIVIYNSDHGGVLPRSKRFLNRQGLHCPLIVRIPEKYRELWPANAPGMAVDDLVSFVDMPKTWLSLAQVDIPRQMQGRVFLGPDAEPEPAFVFAYRGRMDGRQDNARAVTDGEFLYVRNYMPYVPWMQHLQYMWLMQATQAWEEEVKAGRANELQAQYFKPKQSEELYDLDNDPECVDNLIDDPAYAQRVEDMRTALRQWQLDIHDSGLIPETELVRRADANALTPYELVRDPELYGLPAYLDAADIALAQDPANRDKLRALLDSPDVGLRYWGIVGGFLLNDQEAGEIAIDDDSDEVRAMAAWLLIRTGDKEAGYDTLKDLMKNDSYAMLSVLNIIDWMGEDAQPLLPVVESLNLEGQKYPKRLQAILLLH